ncbi:MAG: UDP-N-acetylglucosamine 1-carboxyvinyltransferase [Defluviicoccus sp.]|nr:UDP-N-acetylglucosamine 1-carboxyvinyltransferase [Defluviicoccus sp.]MDE0275140.1 UDP-N-acetylglucosamine 1-carboxyvinyltransferase [Defluviicoccus sp.]
MDAIRLRGGNSFSGTVPIAGAKNAALPLMAASLLTDEPLRLANLPRVADIGSMKILLRTHGVAIANGDAAGEASFDASGVRDTTAPYDLVRRMRASVLVLGPLVARFGRARVSLPGGCAIGTRPIDLHLEALRRLGAEIDLVDGYVEARAPRGLAGADFTFPSVSVGATENALMAACLARGESVLRNAAREPEIVDLGHCLIAMGAKIEGLGTDALRVEGTGRLKGARHRVIADRIEAGTYAIAASMAGGDVTLDGANPEMLRALLETLTGAGVAIEEAENRLRVVSPGGNTAGIDLVTRPYPGFPTDLQAQIMSLTTVASGASRITETIFENRFMHVPELLRMGADIRVRGATALVQGVSRLKGAEVMATDLRASVSLVLAGLVAEGETVVNRIYHLDRGYESIEAKLAACGADIERIAAPG